MAKIPKNLSDKDMMAGYVEDTSLEDVFLKAEKEADAKRRARAGIEPPADLARAGFTPALTDKLGRALLELKMELYREDIREYTFKISRDGHNIVLTPKPLQQNKGLL